MAEAFAEGTAVDALCASVVTSLQESGRFRHIECTALRGPAVGWGDAAAQAVPAGWIDPADTTTTLNTALERLVWRALESTRG